LAFMAPQIVGTCFSISNLQLKLGSPRI